MALRILFVLLFVLVVSSVGLIILSGSPTNLLILLMNDTIGQPVSTTATPVRVTVRSGETASSLGDELAASHVIRSSLAFRTVVRLRGLDSSIEAGDYELNPGANVTAIASSFTVGQAVGGKVTIPEGWRALEIADALDHAGVTTRAAFLTAVGRPTLDPSVELAIPAGHSLEGFLYPDTYLFDQHTDPNAVVKVLVANFASHLSPDLRDGFGAGKLDLNSAVTLASIVEREAVVSSERPTIASVYLNRLHRGMRLQADPTVQYGLVNGDGLGVAAGGYWKRGLTFSDLASSSPYNTYAVTGLPPGPICSPGIASLTAVAHPATTDFLYFVAKPDGTHAFARTLAEHEQNIATFQPAGGAQ